MLQRFATPIISLLFLLFFYTSGLYGVICDRNLDFLFTIRGEKATSQEIIIIGIDEKSIRAIGPWPFPRSKHAELLPVLTQARTIIFDLLFTDSTVFDKQFIKAIKAAPPIVFASARDYNQIVKIPTEILKSGVYFGNIETQIGRGGVVRKPIIKSNSPSSSSPLYQAILEAANIKVPTSADEKLINFYGPEFTFLYLSYSDVLEGKYPPSFFADRFVFIGAQAIGLGDVHLTPFSVSHPTPGVEIQATILNNVLENSAIQTTPVVTAVLLVLICIFSLFLPNLSAKQNTFIVVTFFLGGLAVSLFLFNRNIFINAAIPSSFLLMAFSIHLLSQTLWVAKTIVAKTFQLDQQLHSDLKRLYTNIPNKTINSDFSSKSMMSFTGIQQHISTMEKSIEAITIQSHFISHLLKNETPPLAIWHKNDGKLIIENTTFTDLWGQLFPATGTPSFDIFLELINKNLIQDQSMIYLDDLDRSSADFPLLTEISVKTLGINKNFSISLQEIDSTKSGFSGYLATLSDVTEIRQLERLKGEVLSIVSHELKLPLTTILGYGEILADSLPDEQAKFAEEICSQTTRLNTLIEQFLDIERIESGRYGIQQYPINILTVVDDGINGVTPAAEKKNINITLSAPAKMTPVIGDEMLLLQMYINLLDNAIKFSSEGTTVHTEISEQDVSLTIKIIDQGVGISLEQQNSIFDKFSRGNAGEEKGFGLGLSFVRQVVESHNGTISVTSSPAGSTFTLTLPKSDS